MRNWKQIFKKWKGDCCVCLVCLLYLVSCASVITYNDVITTASCENNLSLEIRNKEEGTDLFNTKKYNKGVCTYVWGYTVDSDVHKVSPKIFFIQHMLPGAQYAGTVAQFPPGVYNLYSVLQPTTYPLTLSDGFLKGITNNVDYQWSKVRLSGSGHQILDVSYTHSAVMVEVILKNAKEMGYLHPALWLQPSSELNATLDLETGRISVATDVHAVFEVRTMDYNKGSFIMVPLKGPKEMKVQVMGYSENERKVYKRIEGFLPLPVEGLVSGLKYTFTGMIWGDAVYFDSPVISHWNVTR